MSRQFYGARRTARPSRPPGRSSGRPASRAKFIERSKYIQAAQPPEVEAAYQPQHQFDQFGLDAQLVELVRRHGYVTPTPIQDQAIPPLLAGRDVVGIANTGTGKTAAFLLPLIDKLLRFSNQGVLVLAPTRELALQIYDELQAFTHGLRLGTALCIGGANIHQQIQRLRRQPHFVIGTPGRIKDLIDRRAFNPELFTNIVLDEVDRMLDIGFRKDILFLISQLPVERQAAFFSATMEGETEDIMYRLMRDPVRISVRKQATTTQVEQDIIKMEPGQNKVEVLHQLLRQPEYQRVIVFGRTKHGINKLETQLSKLGLRVAAIHGNKNQNARQRSLNHFKQGQVQALLATDIAARGIDVEGVTHVINYDEPATYEDYIHRIGRTGRAGKTGKALTFVV